VSDEPEKLIEDVFITQLGAKYPFVKAKGCNDKYGVNGFPTFVVLDPDGVVVQTGMPSDSLIEELLQQVSLPPETPAEPRFDALKAMWRKAEYGKLQEFLDKTLAQPNTDAAMRDVCTAHKEALAKRTESSTKRITALGAGPDYATAEDKLERIEKEWKGLPPSDAAKKERARIAADPAIKKELTAGRALQKVLSAFDPSKPAQRKKLAAELERFKKANEGTFAAKQADEQLTELTKKAG
jgi:hypothetical protein